MIITTLSHREPMRLNEMPKNKQVFVKNRIKTSETCGIISEWYYWDTLNFFWFIKNKYVSTENFNSIILCGFFFKWRIIFWKLIYSLITFKIYWSHMLSAHLFFMYLWMTSNFWKRQGPGIVCWMIKELQFLRFTAWSPTVLFFFMFVSWVLSLCVFFNFLLTSDFLYMIL